MLMMLDMETVLGWPLWPLQPHGD